MYNFVQTHFIQFLKTFAAYVLTYLSATYTSISKSGYLSLSDLTFDLFVCYK